MGSALSSQLAIFRPDQFLSYVFPAGAFSAGGASDLDALNANDGKDAGLFRVGLLEFFDEDDAGALIDSHVSCSQGC